jgi:hypothetical protein
MRTLIAAALALAFVQAAGAHSPYEGFWSGGAPGIGQWCCNGDLEGKTGDCSPAGYRINPDGSALFMPRRYPGAVIFVPRNRILWLSPPDKEAQKFEAHYCGLPRQPHDPKPDDDDPDPAFRTICASIRSYGT